MNYHSFTVSVFTLFFVFLILSTFEGGQQASTETTKSLWSIGTSMPTPRTEITATNIGNDIYVIGGLDKSGKVT